MVQRALIIPDTHIPYHDKSAYGLTIDVAEDVGVEEIVILGDYADFYDINAHGKSPEMRMMLKDEVDAVKMHLSELQRRFPRTKKKYIEGNHEWRLFRYICNKAPELFQMIDTRSLLDLDKYGFEFIPYTPDQGVNVLDTDLIARHEPSKKAGCSIIHGHDHRFHELQEVTLDGKIYKVMGSGWLGNKHHPVYSYVKNHHQWALGASFVTQLENGLWWRDKLEILQHKKTYQTIYEGNIYEAPIQSWR